MKVVGLCGGIGAGKSTVARLLAERGAVVVDVDALGRSVLAHDEVRHAVVAEFGDGVLDADGGIDRAALAREVFSCEGRLTDLEAISHPAIDREIARHLEALASDPPDLVVLDMAVLVESDLGKLSDGRGYTEVVVVEAHADVRLERLVARVWRPTTPGPAWPPRQPMQNVARWPTTCWSTTATRPTSPNGSMS